MKNLLFPLLLILCQCTYKAESTDKVRVVVSIPPLVEFVEQIGGNFVAVSVMVKPGASPHSYEPTPGQLVEMTKAQVYVKMGTPIEFELVWLEKLLSMNENVYVINASSGIEIITGKHDDHDDKEQEYGADPHVWLSPKNAQIMVKNICAGMVNIDPKHKDYYVKNRDTYLSMLDSLDKYIRRTLEAKQVRRFMVYHPSWTYLAQDYGLEQIPVEIEGKEPTAQAIQNLIKEAQQHNIKVIFVSPQFSTKSAEVIAREIQGNVVFIDPLAKDYLANMHQIVRELTEGM